jgi:O-antigen/teichoic acid export membrane protein
MFAMWGLVIILGLESRLLPAIQLLAISLIATALSECSEGILIGHEKIQVIGYVWAIENVLRVIIGVTFIYRGYGLLSIVSVYVFLRFVILIFYTFFIFRFLGRPRLKFKKTFYFHLIRTARTFAVIMIFVTLYWKSDVFMLQKIKGSYAVGIYDGAYRFFGIIVLVISNFVLSLFPVISDFFKTDKHTFNRVCRKTIKYFLILAFPGIVILIFSSSWLILLIFPEQYKASIPLLKILGLAIVPYGMTEIFAHMLIASSNQKIDMMVNGIGMCMNILLNLLLIPKYSSMGAAIATLISIIFYLILQVGFIQKRILDIHIHDLLRFIALLSVSLSGMIIFILLFKSFGIIPVTLLSSMLYFGCTWIFKVISDDDKALIIALAKKIHRVK